MSHQEITDEVVKFAPPAGVSALSLMGVCLSDWVYLVTLVYLALQIGLLLFKIYKHCRCSQ